jgi:hypothetical protein
MTNFKQRLQAAGYTGETDQFYCEVNELFAAHFANFHTDEQLKRHPREALRFCDMIRAQLNLPDLTDEVILGAQENYRKHRKRLAKTA